MSAASWTDISNLVSHASISGSISQGGYTCDLSGFNYDSTLIKHDASVVIKIQVYPNYTNLAFVVGDSTVGAGYYVGGNGSTTLGWTLVKDFFFGYIKQGSISVDENRNTWSCSIEGIQQYLKKSDCPGHHFGWTDLARGKSANASSTLVDTTQESGVEYISASTVEASNVTDGNVDTIWVSNEAPLDTVAMWGTEENNKLKISQVYMGRKTPQWDTSQWLEITNVSDIMYDGYIQNTYGTWQDIHWNGYNLYDHLQIVGHEIKVITKPISNLPSWGGYRSGAYFYADNQTRSESWFHNTRAQVNTQYTFYVSLKGVTGGEKVVVQMLPSESASGQLGDEYTDAEAAKIVTLSTDWQTFSVTATTSPSSTSECPLEIRVAGYENKRIDFLMTAMRLCPALPVKSTFTTDSEGEVVNSTYPLYLEYWSRSQNIYHLIDFDDLKIDAIGGGQSIVVCDDEQLFRRQFGGDVQVHQLRHIDPNFYLDKSGLILRMTQQKRSSVGVVTTTIHDGPEVSPGPTPASNNSNWVNWTSVPLGMSMQRQNPYGTGPFALQRYPCPGDTSPGSPQWLVIDLGEPEVANLGEEIGSAGSITTIVAAENSNFTKYPLSGTAQIDSEQFRYTSRTDQELKGTITRQYNGTPLGYHAVGASIYPVVNYAKKTMHYISGVGWRRRLGTGIPYNFKILLSNRDTPQNPSDYTEVGKLWENHPDWQAGKHIVRGFNHSRYLWVVGHDTDAGYDPDSPPAFTNNGIYARHVAIVIDRMTGGGRAKLNDLMVYEMDSASNAGSGYIGHAPPDVKGIIKHLLVRHFGIAEAQLLMSRPGGIAYGYVTGYGDLDTAKDSYWSVIEDLCNKTNVVFYVNQFGKIAFLPHHRMAMAVLDETTFNWTADSIWSLETSFLPSHNVTQVEVNARDERHGMNYRVRYPKSVYGNAPEIVNAPYAGIGQTEQIDNMIVGDQNTAMLTAKYHYLDSNKGWTGTIKTGICDWVRLYQRCTITLDMDSGGSEFSGRNFIIEGVDYDLDFSKNQWTTSVQLTELVIV